MARRGCVRKEHPFRFFVIYVKRAYACHNTNRRTSALLMGGMSFISLP